MKIMPMVIFDGFMSIVACCLMLLLIFSAIAFPAAIIAVLIGYPLLGSSFYSILFSAVLSVVALITFLKLPY